MTDSPYPSQFKSWIFPGIVSILGMMIWQDVTEIKADVKALIAQSNVDKTRIDALERQVYKTTSYRVPFPFKNASNEAMFKMVGIINKDEEYELDRKDI